MIRSVLYSVYVSAEHGLVWLARPSLLVNAGGAEVWQAVCNKMTYAYVMVIWKPTSGWRKSTSGGSLRRSSDLLLRVETA